MATTATSTAPVPGVLTVSFEDISMLKDIKKAISMVRGVTKVSVPRRKHLTGMEQAMRDIKDGRVYHAESVDDMFRQILGEDYVPA